jgi:hypothetical protein
MVKVEKALAAIQQNLKTIQQQKLTKIKDLFSQNVKQLNNDKQSY